MKWFLATLKVETNGGEYINGKKIERYLVDAISFAEAETRVIAELFGDSPAEVEVEGKGLMNVKQLTSGMECIRLQKANIKEVLENEKEGNWDWYRVRIAFVSFDEAKGKEKLTTSTWMVEAADCEDAIRRTNLEMANSMDDYEIVEVRKTDIVGLIKYQIEGE